MQTLITEKQRTALVNSIYNNLMNISQVDTEGNRVEMDMGDMGSCKEVADEIVRNWMIQENVAEGTPVIFLYDKDPEGPSNVFAYFPETDHNKELKVSYAHIGQHSSCAPDYAQECDEVIPEYYEDLKSELENLGYVLIIRTKEDYNL